MSDITPKERPVAATEITPVVMTNVEVGALLCVRPKTVYTLKDRDGLPYHKFGGSVRFYLHEVLDWMDQQPSSKQEVL